MWERRPAADVADRILGALFPELCVEVEAEDEVEATERRGPGNGSVGDGVSLTPFQEMGLRRVRRILDSYGGAVLADAVGLGKTYIALAHIQARLRDGYEVVVVVPAALRRHWARPLRRLPGSEPGRGRGVRLLSHTQLSRGHTAAWTAPRRLVVVDEAHRFRNPDTLRYAALARLVYGAPPAELLLITASPINNGPGDLFHLVRLFLPDHALAHAGVPSVRGAFEDPGGTGAGTSIPTTVRSVVRAVVVRRTRSMIERRFGDASPPGADVRFPRRAAPVLHGYADHGLEARVRVVEGLELAVYGDEAGLLVRFGLLKRLASSPEALAVSVGRLRGFLEAAIDAARARRLLRPADRPAAGDGDPFQLLIAGVVARPAPPDADLDALIASAHRDLRALAGIRAPDGAPGAADPDGKRAALAALLRRVAGERVVVFTEYRDTAEALWRGLAPGFRVGRVDGAGAWLGRDRAGRRAVIERFAPAANGRPPPSHRERVDVLIATDVLAEGLNLQDARHVVSYDLPWNPVRLLQRIGRIDRLGSPHATVVPHLFVPATGVDAVLGLTRRLQGKLGDIVGAVGGEHAAALLDGLARGRPDRVDRALHRAEGEADDPWERLRTLGARRAGTARRTGPAHGSNAPWVATVVTDDPELVTLEAVALAVDGAHATLVEVPRSGPTVLAGHRAARLLEIAAAMDSDGTGPVPAEPQAGILARVEARLARDRAAGAAPPRLGHNDPGAKLARRIRSALAAAGSGLHAPLLDTAERVLVALHRPAHPALEAALSALLHQTPPSATAREIVLAAARLLESETGRTPVPAARVHPDAPSIRAVIRVAASPPTRRRTPGERTRPHPG